MHEYPLIMFRFSVTYSHTYWTVLLKFLKKGKKGFAIYEKADEC